MFYTTLSAIGKALATVGFALGAFLGLHYAPAPGATIPQVPAFTSDSLASTVGKTDTSMTLVNGTDGEGNTLSGYYGFVIDEGTSIQETVGCTAAGTSLTGCIRGIDLVTGTSSNTALEQIHRRGATVKVTTYPFLGIVSNILQGKETLPTILLYTSGIASSTFTNGHGIVDKDYVDFVGTAGCANATTGVRGCIQLGTAAQAASSTALAGGSTGASLVLSTNYATDTRNSATSKSDLLMSDLTGYLNQAWINLTQNFTFTGFDSFSALFATNASSTNATTTHLYVTGITSALLGTDSNGQVISTNPPRYTFATTSAIVKGNGYATSSALSIPAGFMTASSTVTVKGQFSCAVGASSSGDTCDVYVKDLTNYSTLVSHTGFPTVDNGNTTYTGTFSATIFMSNSTSAEVGYMSCSYFGVSPAFVAGKFTWCGDNASASSNWANAFSVGVVIHASGNTTATLSNMFVEVDK